MRSVLALRRSQVMQYSVLLLAAGVGLLFLWPGLADNLLRSEGFMPHGHCYLWLPGLVWLHVSSDLLIGISYVLISLTLAYLVYRARRDIPFHWVFLAFGLFIIACGSTHFMEIWTLWQANYWLSGYVKLVTAVASVATALVLPPLIPRTLALVKAAKVSEERREKLQTAHEELELLYEKTKELDQLKTQFFANVSHELRTPLTLIIGPVEKLLTAENLSPEQRQSLSVVRRNANTLLKHVNDLLDISKLEAGQLTVNYSEVDLARHVRLIASHFGSSMVNRLISFSLETPDHLPAEIDPDKFKRILLNLISNAFKFTPDGGTVRCTLRAGDSGQAVVEVADSGPGVAPELREVIFERFHQGDASATRRFGGTGLGLSIVREFVELHGGKVTVGDAPEGGALFRVELPLRAPSGVEVHPEDYHHIADDTGDFTIQTIDSLRTETQRQTGTTAPDAPTPLRQPLHQAPAEAQPTSETTTADASDASISAAPVETPMPPPLVLVVEDNAEMNQFIVETLSDEFRVERAFDGREGLQKAVELRPDLILSDMMMPHLSGDELLREVRRHEALDNVPVVLLTAKADDELRTKLLRRGAQDYVMKPFVAEELRARVGNLVAMKRAREVLQARVAGQTQDIEALAHELAALLESEQRARQSAEEANRLKDEFLAVVSHELRTPLTPILGWTRLLRNVNFTQRDALEALERIERNAVAQQQIVNDLLDVSSIITGRFRFDPRTIRLTPVIESAITTVEASAEAKSIQIETRLEEDAAPVLGDPDRLQQVMWNLLSNAVKFTPKGGRVRVELERVDSQVEIRVSDTGTGIAPEFLPYVFDRFRQADSSSTRPHGGLGLGLSIVRHLVEMQGGTVEARSEGEGKGATFIVRLPVSALSVEAVGDEDAPRRDASDLGAEQQPPSLEGLRVVVVDDDPDTLEMLAIILRQYGAEVTVSKSAAEALEAVERLRPEVLISDIEMPHEDGYALIRKVRQLEAERGGKLQAVALTAYARSEDRARALLAGFQIHTPKPIEPLELVAVVASLAGRT
jgi:signal transduction histidine kinase